ncbi:unnamed protein product, partial [Ectocarpus sp. 12 AP-2014]
RRNSTGNRLGIGRGVGVGGDLAGKEEMARQQRRRLDALQDAGMEVLTSVATQLGNRFFMFEGMADNFLDGAGASEQAARYRQLVERLKADAAASTVTMAPPYGANPPTWGSANPSPHPSPGRGRDYDTRPAYTLPPNGGKSWMSGITSPAATAGPPHQQYLSRGASEG